MAAGYFTDPATGLPMIQTAGGVAMPLPLSEDDMRQAGAQLTGPPGLPPAPPAGPDLRLADNTAPTDPSKWGNAIPTLPAPTQGEQVADIRAQLAPPAASAHATAPAEPNWMPTGAGQPPARPAINPTDLARPSASSGGSASPGQSGGASGLDPLEQLAFEQALQGRGGGGGPRGLGVTSETRKYKEAGAVPDEVSAAARDAQGASDVYNQELAKSLLQRQEQGYQAYQGEQAARAGELQAQRAHFEARQQELQAYSAKRDALAAEAAQMKAPQMEDYWGSRSDTAKMATAVSIALGGALQGLRGGSNPGLEMSNQNIDRWILLQKEAYQRKQGAVDNADNKYARMVQAFGSEDLAEQHLREQAWTVRDGMLKAYAEKIGTPNALEAYNQAQLQTEAQRAALLQQAYQTAGAEIEQKLAMQGGGGGAARPKVKDAVHDAALVHKDLADLRGDGNEPGRAIEGGKIDDITAAINTIDAADEIRKHVKSLGYADSDTDDPLSGGYDYVKNAIPGTQGKHSAQDLDRATQNFARGLQQSLGKSDNDAILADKLAAGGGSGRQRLQSADAGTKRATAKIQDTLAGMTPDQKRAFIKALPEDRRQRVLQIVGSSAGQAPVASERPF